MNNYSYEVSTLNNAIVDISNSVDVNIGHIQNALKGNDIQISFKMYNEIYMTYMKLDILIAELKARRAKLF